MATIESIANDIQMLQKDMKSLRKMIRKVLGDIEDPSGEKKAARAQNNGFNKLQDVTPKLRAFLNLAADQKISRSQVTKAINAYVEEKGLKAGQNISLDAALKDLLQVPEGTQVTFLNIQKYINPHFVKEPKEAKEPKTTKRKEAEPTLSASDVKVERPKVAKKLKAAASA